MDATWWFFVECLGNPPYSGLASVDVLYEPHSPPFRDEYSINRGLVLLFRSRANEIAVQTRTPSTMDSGADIVVPFGCARVM